MCVLAVACGSQRDPVSFLLPDPGAFTGVVNGHPCRLYVLRSHGGAQAAFSPYGARLVRWLVPDSAGGMVSVIKGLDSLWQYATNPDQNWGAAICEGCDQESTAVWNTEQANDSTLVFTANGVQVVYVLLGDYQLSLQGRGAGCHSYFNGDRDGEAHMDTINATTRELFSIHLVQDGKLEVWGSGLLADTIASRYSAWGQSGILYKVKMGSKTSSVN